uniref:Uncharacterized protein n=1 Tax=Rhodosorus marinus TaxID=101924 RepID=A0A7S2ZFP3_9RHOD|mmetsp:Transcript_18040/g.72205  ORF Transcript_18040/g.72205 Transcript_18040/m.72205 type:complete len:243 (+) Transcript_18040:78-806(+)
MYFFARMRVTSVVWAVLLLLEAVLVDARSERIALYDVNLGDVVEIAVEVSETPVYESAGHFSQTSWAKTQHVGRAQVSYFTEPILQNALLKGPRNSLLIGAFEQAPSSTIGASFGGIVFQYLEVRGSMTDGDVVVVYDVEMKTHVHVRVASCESTKFETASSDRSDDTGGGHLTEVVWTLPTAENEEICSVMSTGVGNSAVENFNSEGRVFILSEETFDLVALNIQRGRLSRVAGNSFRINR